MVILLVINAGVMNAIFWITAPAGFGETVLQHTWSFLLGHSNDDSWWPMMRALDYFENEYVRAHTAPFYTELVFDRGVKFQYPPSSLFFLMGARAVATLAYGKALANDAISWACNTVSWACVLLTAIATAALLENRLRLSDPSSRYDNLGWLRATVVIALTLTFYPVVKAFSLGQIQAWINGLIALAFLLWATERKAWAGLAIGIVVLIKPHFGILLAWAVIRRDWRFVIACALTIAFGLALSLYVFGWENHADYLRLLSYLSQRGEAFYPNQSINGLLNRLMSIADPVRFNNLDWLDDQFPPYNPWVYGGTLASSALILGLALLRRRHRDDADGMMDFCTIAVSCTLASPIAWEHHYGILLPVFAVLVASSIHTRRRLIWLAVSFVFASNYIPVTKLLAYTPLNVAQSYLLGAGLFVVVLLHRRTPLTATGEIAPGTHTNAAKAAIT